MSSEHTHVLSRQNGNWPSGQPPVQSSVVSHDDGDSPQLQPGASDRIVDRPTHATNVTTNGFGHPRRARRTRRLTRRPRRLPARTNPTSNTSATPDVDGPFVLHWQPPSP